jgi:segregation and condensation protein B
MGSEQWRAPENLTATLDLDLEDLPAPARWRERMGRVEAAIFAAGEPVLRESLARVVGKACNLDLIIDYIRDELRGRPYELVSVAGGWSFRTKLGFGAAIRTALGTSQRTELSKSNALALMGIAYFQPITRGELSQFLGREVSRDAIASLRGEGLIAAGPRSPTPGAPYAYVTTPAFLAQFGFESLRDLPDIEKLKDAGLLGRTGEAFLDSEALASELRGVLGLRGEEEDAAWRDIGALADYRRLEIGSRKHPQSEQTADCAILIEHPQGQIGLGHPKASDFDSQNHTQGVEDVSDCIRPRGPT